METTDHVLFAGFAVWLIQLLKAKGWVSRVSTLAQRLGAALAAAASAAGLTITYAANGEGTLTIAGITFATVASFLWLAAKQLVLQEVIYRGAVKD